VDRVSHAEAVDLGLIMSFKYHPLVTVPYQAILIEVCRLITIKVYILLNFNILIKNKGYIVSTNSPYFRFRNFNRSNKVITRFHLNVRTVLYLFMSQQRWCVCAWTSWCYYLEVHGVCVCV